MKNNIIPAKISKYSETEMEIEWTNGTQSIIPFRALRFYCNCAECVDEWTRKRKVLLDDIRSDINPIHIEVVGRYAIQVQWSDGHKTGIYPFDYLYTIASDNNEKKE